MSIILEARGVTRVLAVEPPVTLVKDVNLKIERGSFTAIVGPSGCGKSSLLYLLGLLDRPTSGEILVEGQAVDSLSGDERSNIRLSRFGFVFQFHFLLPEFTALENVMMPIRRLGRLGERDARDRAAALLNSMGLSGKEGRTPDRLSGGERQRVAVARALANDPPLVLCDEPTGNLDSVSSTRVVELLRELAHGQARAIVCVTHDLDIAAVADIQIEMLDGGIERIRRNVA